MRPQDIYILLGIASDNDTHFLMSDLAKKLNISASEVSESLNRSLTADLIDITKKRVNRKNLLEFLIHGLSYVFPEKPGALTRGIPTAYSAPPLDSIIKSNERIVWPSVNGLLGVKG